MQYFKGDADEIKMFNTVAPAANVLSLTKDEFFEDCFNCGALGDIIYDSNRAPLTSAISKSIFRSSFSEIFNSFIVAGSFESYITVFKKIFGNDVLVTFTIPDAGKLIINIEASGVEESLFITRYIEDNDYVLDTIIDDEDDNIVFQTIKGFTTQYELEQMLKEMVPAGIYTEIELELGS